MRQSDGISAALQPPLTFFALVASLFATWLQARAYSTSSRVPVGM